MASPGERFGEWVVEGVIASGGQGAVLRARHAVSGAAGALKVLHKHDDRAVRRFKQEAAVLARLSHPNLVRVLEHGERAGSPFLVMDLVDGQPLDALVDERGPPAHDFTARALAAVARALAHCHERGVVHRDLKPANIIIERGTGRPVIVDFGLARRDKEVFGALSIDARSRLSRTGELRGTPFAMAPEQVTPTTYGEVGPATDVYALGVTLYVLLTGAQPFPAGSLAELIAAILEAPAPDARELAPSVPARLARLAQVAMSKQPRDRPASAEAFARALEAAPTSRALLVASAVALASLVVIVASLALRPGEPPAPTGTVGEGAPPVDAAPAKPAQPAQPAPAAPGLGPAARLVRSPGGRLGVTRVLGAYDEKHVNHIWAIALSPDETRSLSGSGFWSHACAGTVQLREVATGRELRAWRAHASTVSGAAFTDDGRRGLTSSFDGAVRLWDLDAEPAPALDAPLDELRDGSPAVYLERLGAGDRFLLARRSGAVSVIRVVGGARLEVVVERRVPGPLLAAAALRDDAALVETGDVLILDLARGTTQRVAGPFHETGLAVAPDRRRVLVTEDESVTTVDLAAGGSPRRIDSPRRWVWSVDWLPDSRRALFGRFDGRAAVFDVDAQAEAPLTCVPQNGWGMAAVRVLRDGRRALAGGGDGRLRLIDVAADRLLTPVTPGALATSVERLAASSDGASVVVGGASWTTAVTVLDRATGAPRALDVGVVVAGVGLDPTGARALVCGVAPGGEASVLQVWDLARGARVASVDAPGKPSAALLSPDGRVAVAAGDADGAGWWRLWRVDEVAAPRELPTLGMPVVDLACTPDGRVIVAIASRWDATHSQLLALEPAGGLPTSTPLDLGATSVALFPAGDEALVGGSHGEVVRVRLRDGERTNEYPAHAGSLIDVAVSPDALHVASAGNDGLLRVSGDSRSDALDLGLTGDVPTALTWLDARTLLVGTRRGVVLEVAVRRR